MELADEALNPSICCTIGLTTDIIIFKLTKLQYVAECNCLRYFNDQPAFIFDVTSNTVVHQGEDAIKNSKHLGSTQIFIGNILLAIQTLYRTYKVQEKHDISKDSTFAGIIKYFEKNLVELCKSINITVNQIFIVFTLPNYFALELEAFDVIFKPLFVKVGVITSEKEVNRITILTHLESLLINYQLGHPYERPPNTSYLRRENQCLVYNLYLNDERTPWETSHIHIKEDYTASLFEDRCYTPKFISVEENPNLVDLNFTSIRQAVTDFIMVKLDKSFAYDKNVTDRILLYILYRFCDHNSSPSQYRHDDAEGDETFLKNYLSTEKLTFLKSTDLLESVEWLFTGIFSKLLDIIVQHVQSAYTIHSHVSKSLIVNGHLKSKNNFNYCIYDILFHLLTKQLQFTDNVYVNMVEHRTFIEIESTSNVVGYNGYHLLTRRLMVSNLTLPPLIVNDQPIYTKNQATSKLRYIVHIDVSVDATVVVCTEIDNNGRVCDSKYIEQQNLPLVLDSKIVDPAKQTLKSSFKPHWTYPAKAFKYLVYCNFRKRKIIVPAQKEKARKDVIECLQKLMDQFDEKLESMQIDHDQVGYAICFAKSATNILQLDSREEISEFTRRSVPHRRVVSVDQGDQLVWQAIQTKKLQPSSYYVHSHITDDYIYSKLYQVVDTKRGLSAVFIQEDTISTNNIYRQVAELIFSYVQVLEEEDKTENCHGKGFLLDFQLFEERLTHFIRAELSDIHYQNRNTRIDFGKPRKLFNIAIQELIDIAIIPLLKEKVDEIVVSMTDSNIFGNYDITKLFLTGSFLRVRDYSQIHHYIIESELSKYLTHALLHKSYKTNFETLLTTSQKQSSRNLGIVVNQEHYCYEKLLWGELRTICNSVYLHRGNPSVTRDAKSCAMSKYGFSSELLSQGEQFMKKRLKLKGFHVDQVRLGIASKGLEIYSPGVEEHTVLYMFVVNAASIPATLQVEYLHYRSCIKISVDWFIGERKDKLYLMTQTAWIVERQVLKYF